VLHNVAVNNVRVAKHCIVAVAAATARVLVVIAVAASSHSGAGSAVADVLFVSITRPQVCVARAVRRRGRRNITCSPEDSDIDNDDNDNRDDDSSD